MSTSRWVYLLLIASAFVAVELGCVAAPVPASTGGVLTGASDVQSGTPRSAAETALPNSARPVAPH